ncbi:hypothetical protein [Paludifilum halophilum]|uniref:Uncharacterized protein n=1 Tax=Paludifilum halophilum TaxID=1642702 RepID=A0A235B5U2_9BACL|nr:hypothetical protein [Paludifilum halophilum]OYD07660.1 hypothetical protein CHM34_09265 [Paludifilum halophilum]
MPKPKNTDGQLRRIVRRIIREELARAQEEGLPPPEPDFSPEPRPDREERPEGPPPPWAVFGSPEPVSERSEGKRHRDWKGPYEPDWELDPPPFMPRKIDRD